VPFVNVTYDEVSHWGDLRKSAELGRAGEAANRGIKVLVAGDYLCAVVRHLNAAAQ
jgi:hypothetical protein